MSRKHGLLELLAALLALSSTELNPKSRFWFWINEQHYFVVLNL